MRLQNALGLEGAKQEHSIQFLESAVNVRSVVQQATGRAPNARKARDIATFVQQGRMFFEAADEAAIEIRPLILYYGMMAFAKAIIIARTPANIEALPQRHGLSDTSEQTSLLKDLSLRIEQGGTFQQFNDVIAQKEGVRYIVKTHSKFHPTPSAESAALSGQALTLKTILSHCSQVSIPPSSNAL